MSRVESSADYERALLNALRFDEPSASGLAQLTGDDWNRMLLLCDSQQLTLLIGYLHSKSLPPAVHERIERNFQDNARRFQKLSSTLVTITHLLSGQGIETTVLKGVTHNSDFVPDPLLRSQGDIDLWCSAAQILDAKFALMHLGYYPVGKSKGRHLDPMIRELVWNWNGNYYDPDLPIPVELHYRLWDTSTERLPGLLEPEVWSRRRRLQIDDAPLAFQLSAVDTFAFAALHVLLHLLHGDPRLQRAWELGYFLQKNQGNDVFWSEWRATYPPELRQVQTVPLALAALWFGCALPLAVQESIDELPPNVLTWLKHYHLSPLKSALDPGGTAKEELWLHLALLTSIKSKTVVCWRRLAPLQAIGSQATQETQYNKGAWSKAVVFLMRRAAHHLGALPATLSSGIRFWRWCRADAAR
ncbi:MAG TPA: nucleotidyltransferase family protein [Bryobacteraceae bacterium]